MEIRPAQWHPSLTLVFILLGFLLATAFNTQQKWAERPGPRKQNLIQLIRKQQEERERLANQLATVRKQVGKFDSEISGNQGVWAARAKELEDVKARAGLKAGTGPGIEILMADAARIPAGADADSFLIHDYDLQIVVNALWRAGAESIAVNGERVVVNTGIRSAGSTILINAKPQGSPYRLKAIGKPGALARALKKDADAALLINDYAQKYGLVLKVKTRNRITLPAYGGSLRLDSAGR